MFTRRASPARFSPRQRRILTWCGVIFGVIFIYLWIFGIAAWFVVVKGRQFAGNDPALWKTPAKLKDFSISNVPGRKFSYFGYEFEMPWDDLEKQAASADGSVQAIHFHTGVTVIFSKRAETPFMEQDNFRASLNRFFGSEPLRSDYAFTRATLETTPGDITLFTPQPQAVRRMTMLLLKSTDIIANSGESGVFLIQTKDFRGFQYGNPDSRPSRVVDDLYLVKGWLQFVFLENKNGAGISQPEINRVIQSVRAVQN
jgi:hypothetical protein